MVTQELLGYIKSELQRGVSKEQIKNSLLKIGWQGQDIEEGFSHIEAHHINSPASIPQPGQPQQQTLQVWGQKPQPTYAGFWLRLAALFIDVLVFSIPICLIFLVLYLIIRQSLGIQMATLSSLIYILIVLFLWLFFTANYGATPGKMLFGIKIVKSDQTVPGWKIAVLREILGKLVSLLILSFGYVWIAFDAEKQGIHDKIASTHVIFVQPITAGKKILVFILILLFIFVPIGFALAGYQFINSLPKKFSKTTSGGTITFETQIEGPSFDITLGDQAKSYVEKTSKVLIDYKNKNGKYPDPFEFDKLVQKPRNLNYTYLPNAEKASLSASNRSGGPIWCWTSTSNQVTKVSTESECNS